MMVLWSSFYVLSEARMPERSTFGDAKMGPQSQGLPAWCLCHSVPFSLALMARSLISSGLQKGGFSILLFLCTYLLWFFCKE